MSDAAWRLLLGLVLLTLILVSVLGNILVCIAIGTDQRLRKLSNLFLVSLAIADLLVAALVMPLALVNDLRLWTMGQTLCKAWIAVDVMCSTASIVNLCAISLDRYIHIKDPLQYTELITRRSVPATIALIWATSALISLLPISLNMHAAAPTTEDDNSEYVEMDVGNEEESSSCVLDFNPTYSICSSVFSFFIPCVIMLFIYFHVYSFARYHMKSIREQSRPLLRLRRMSQDARQQQQVLAIVQQQQMQQIAEESADGNGNGGFRNHGHVSSTQCLMTGELEPHTTVSSASSALVISSHVNLNNGDGLATANGNNVKRGVVGPAPPDAAVGNNSNSNGVSGRGAIKAKWSDFRALVSRSLLRSPTKHASAAGDSPLLQEHKAAITIGIIMGVFLLCWAPFFIANVIVGLCKDCVPPLLFQILTWLGYSNSAFNPIIYSIFNVEFREAFGKTLRQLRPSRQNRLCCCCDDDEFHPTSAAPTAAYV